MKCSFSIMGLVAFGALSIATTRTAKAEAPKSKTSAPFINLADNLGKEANLGWCIDTVGRGFGEQLQSHSCKPTKGDNPDDNDVKLMFDEATGHIASLAFENNCMVLSAPETENIPFGLLDWSSDPSRKFTYDAASGQFSPAANRTLCVAVPPTSRKAGLFMSRDLKLSPCEGTDSALTTSLMKSDYPQSRVRQYVPYADLQ